MDFSLYGCLVWIPWRWSLYEDYCGLQQPGMLYAFEETVIGSCGQSRRTESRTTRVTISVFFTLVIILLWLIHFNWFYYCWILRFFVFSAAHVALGIQQWYQSLVQLKRIIRLKIDCGCCFWFNDFKIIILKSLILILCEIGSWSIKEFKENSE